VLRHASQEPKTSPSSGRTMDPATMPRSAQVASVLPLALRIPELVPPIGSDPVAGTIDVIVPVVPPDAHRAALTLL